MYYFVWLVLIVVCVWISAIGFIWALRTGQFSDQQRARYLPLAGEALFEVKEPPKRRPELYAASFILGAGLILLLVTVCSLIFQGGR